MAKKKRTAKSKVRINYCMILDKSGSMFSCQQQTVDGFNEQIQTIRDLEKKFPDQEYRVTLTTFNHVVTIDKKNEPVSEITELNNYTYQPFGSTALNEAIGETITYLRDNIAKEEKVIICIITDGYENASNKYTNTEELKQFIQSLSKERGWIFNYINGDLNVKGADAAMKFGIASSNVMDYSPSQSNTMHSKLSKSFVQYAASVDKGVEIVADSYLGDK